MIAVWVVLYLICGLATGVANTKRRYKKCMEGKFEHHEFCECFRASLKQDQWEGHLWWTRAFNAALLFFWPLVVPLVLVWVSGKTLFTSIDKLWMLGMRK